MERALKGKGFIKEKKERQGPKGKIAFLPPLPLAGKQRSGAGSPAVAVAGGLGLGGGREEGKRKRGVRGGDPLP